MRCWLLATTVALLAGGAGPAPRAASVLRFAEVKGWPAGAVAAPKYGTDEVTGVAAGAEQLFVLQHTLPAVLVFNHAGEYLRSWGQDVYLRHSCRLDPDGNLWLVGIYDHQLAKYSPDGQLLQIWGQKDVTGDDQANHFNGPADVAFGPDGSAYIADGYFNARVVHLDRSGAYVGEWGSKGKKWGQFRLLHSVATDAAGNVYVADRDNSRVQVFTGAGQFLRGWRLRFRPYSVYVGPDQRLYLSGEKEFVTYTLVGKAQSVTRVPDMKGGHMLSVDAAGAVYLADLDGNRVRKFVRR